jgi:hypothetical protein
MFAVAALTGPNSGFRLAAFGAVGPASALPPAGQSTHLVYEQLSTSELWRVAFAYACL